MLVDPRFLLLVAVCWATFVSVPPRFRSHGLAAWGVVFYALYAPYAGWLAAALVVFTYLANTRRLRWMAVLLVVGLLAYFKRPAALTAAARAGLTELRTGGPLVPLGFSYLSLELIHYVVERGRGRIARVSFMDLAAFAFFFPCRAAGPIKRYGDFTASVAQASPSSDDVLRGCLRILAGLLKKVLADAVGRRALPPSAVATPFQAWTTMLAYAFELYLDFSAYSDIAIGISRLMGIRVPENFNWPYLSPNIQDFWTRWHMSLSSWARDYIFLGVGRSLFRTRLRARPGLIATAGYATTFLAIGAWHGLTANFLAWGAYHALLVTGYYFYRRSLPVRVTASAGYRSPVASWAGTVLTFALVTIGWVLFRLDLPEAVRVIRLMLNASRWSGHLSV